MEVISKVDKDYYDHLVNGVYRCLLYLGDLARSVLYLRLTFVTSSFTDTRNSTQSKSIRILQKVFDIMREQHYLCLLPAILTTR